MEEGKKGGFGPWLWSKEEKSLGPQEEVVAEFYPREATAPPIGEVTAPFSKTFF